MVLTLKPDLFQAYPEVRFGSMDSERAVSAQHTPRQNRLLAALPPEDYERLLPDLEPVPLPPGWIVHEAGEPEKYLYFPTEGIVSRSCVTEGGASAEFAVTGSEGLIGVATFLGGESTSSQAAVVSSGHAYRLKAAVLQRAFAHGGALVRLVLRYTQALITQTALTAMCNRRHPLEQQLCRWLLICLDRLPSNELAMTQLLIAKMLGVRRVGVTNAAARLQAAGLIDYRRGRITVLDRPQIEKRVCECYAVIKREYARLLPGFRQAEVTYSGHIHHALSS